MPELPKIKLRFPWLLIRKLARLMNAKIDFDKFGKVFNEFNEFLEKYRDKILGKISEKGGFEWREKDICVYAIPEQIRVSSMSYPLILKLRKDNYLNLYFLTHELCHHYIEENDELIEISYRKWRKKNKLIPEAIVEFLTVSIIAELFGEKLAEELHEKEKEIVTTRNMEESYKLANKFKESFNQSLPSPKRFLVLLEEIENKS